MSEVTRLNTSRPRKIGETVYSDRGLRLSPMQHARDSGWFWPLMTTLPLAAFVFVFFW
jgi:hypothetical protein